MPLTTSGITSLTLLCGSHGFLATLNKLLVVYMLHSILFSIERWVSVTLCVGLMELLLVRATVPFGWTTLCAQHVKKTWGSAGLMAGGFTHVLTVKMLV